jgi:hypothetical protein
MVDHFLFPASVGLAYQLENGANSMKAAVDCRAVEIPKPVENQASDGLVLVVTALKAYSTLSVQLPSAFGLSLKTCQYSWNHATTHPSRRETPIAGCISAYEGR